MRTSTMRATATAGAAGELTGPSERPAVPTWGPRQRRKRWRGAGPAVVAALAAWLGGCVPPTPEEPVAELPDLGGREVVVAVFDDLLPYSRINPATGSVEGWDHDLIVALAAELNFAPRFVIADPQTIRDEIVTGQVDIVGGGIAYTLQRDEAVDFAAAYELVKHRIAVRATETRVATIAAFHDDASLRAGSVPGTTSHDFAVGYLGAARVADFDSFSAALDALAAGAVDGIVLDDADLLREQQRRRGEYVALSGTVGADVLAFVLPRDSDLAVPINAAYETLVDDGTVAALRAKWDL